MWLCSALLLLSTVLCIPRTVSGLGSSCSAPLGSGTASSTDPYWLETIKHQGTSPFNSDPNSYQVFRNVKDFGAKGDGVTDDTAAINAAMSSGTRCGGGSCAESTLTPAIVYFPQGTYLVSSPINTYYYTEMIGDAKNPPSLLARSNFRGFAVIDADPYIPNGWGAQWFANQNNFFRSVRNMIIDMRQIPSRNSAIGLHWQVAQATSLVNVVVEMSTASGTNHQGMFMENGSGGFMGDIIFNGGKIGIQVGNQQFTVRNLTINNADVAVSAIWNWGFTFQGVTINNCQIGFDLNVGGATQTKQGVGSEAIIDAVVTNTPVFVRSSVASNGTLPYSLVLNNIQLTNVPTAVGVGNGGTILAGGTTTIASWGQGHMYSGTGGQKTWVQSNIPSVNKPPMLLDSAGRIFGKARPQYADYATSQIISVKSQGAKGDGKTDDTAAIQNVFNQYAGCKIIFFDAGVYYVTDTITIPAGTQIVGEAWTVILGGGSNFQSQTNPRVVIQVGTPGSQGIMEISGILFSTAGPAAGAIVLEWNVHDPSGQQGAAGLWDTHIRLGGAKGTNMQVANCAAGSVNTACQAAFLGIHLTSGSSAYFEGTWVWTADHDVDAIGSPQTSIFTGRGILSESAGPVWFIGTSEHASLYQYNLVNAQNHYIGFAQTENPYYQPVPAAPAPYESSSTYHDPTFSDSVDMAWAMNVRSSSNIILFGAGFYTFYQHYGQTCLTDNSCQTHVFNIDSASSVTVYSVSTVGSTYQLSVGQNGVVGQTDNQDGFQSTFTAWSN
ncbi:glycoside hydrolase family 55 protein [Boletus edulis BED1]|uniref:Glycoside hydrolase family 55 protein n=1 Tax=Boletus edulis BED1 TaxID=1328754 RepID=A0AAD4BTI2_BOLED|nr:glycoside hydrolase family 55 protein [Boletus edulis BED1]